MWDERFEEILRRHLPFLAGDGELSAQLNLKDFGLDSLGTVSLLSQLESAYGIRFVDDALEMENFATPERMWTTISRIRLASDIS